MGVAPNPLPGLPCGSWHTQMWWRTCSTSKCVSTRKGLVKYDKQISWPFASSNFLRLLANLESDLISKEVGCIHNNPYPKFFYFGLPDVVRVCWLASQPAHTCASKNNPQENKWGATKTRARKNLQQWTPIFYLNFLTLFHPKRWIFLENFSSSENSSIFSIFLISQKWGKKTLFIVQWSQLNCCFGTTQTKRPPPNTLQFQPCWGGGVAFLHCGDKKNWENFG